MGDWWQQLTIVVPSSPVPSNPATATLRTVFGSFALVPGLSRVSKIVQFDGPQRGLPPSRVADYDEFERRVRELAARHADFSNTSVFRSAEFLFASHNLAAAVGQVCLSSVNSGLHVRRLDPCTPGRYRLHAGAPARLYSGATL